MHPYSTNSFRVPFIMMLVCLVMISGVAYKLLKNNSHAETFAPVAPHGEALSYGEAGLKGDHESQDELVSIKKIETINGQRVLTFDPIVLADDPKIRNGFVVQNDDTTTKTLVLNEDSGPFFISHNVDGKRWRKLNDEQINALIAGTVDLSSYSPDYYMPDLTNNFALFFITTGNNGVTKVAQKYFPERIWSGLEF